MAMLQQMPYDELNRWIAAQQGGQAAIDERSRRLLSGDATWDALKAAIEQLSKVAPPEHDVVIKAFNIMVLKAFYIEPHTFLFQGIDESGNLASLVCQYTQVVAQVVYLPKREPQRIITGFSVLRPN